MNKLVSKRPVTDRPKTMPSFRPGKDSLLAKKTAYERHITHGRSLTWKLIFHSLNRSCRFSLFLSFLTAEYADDIWLNLSDQDLEDILSKYSDPKSTQNGTEDGTINSESTLDEDVSTVYMCFFCVGSCLYLFENVNELWRSLFLPSFGVYSQFYLRRILGDRH